MKAPKDKRSKIKRWLWGLVVLLVLTGLLQMVMSNYGDEEKELRSQFREAVTEKFPRLAGEFSETMGLFPYEKQDKTATRTGQAGQSVILVHGLDDPGKVWQSLAPELVKNGHEVWLLNYPNDQPIEESAQFFLEQLRQQAQLGMGRIAIVSHSMGGLVSREMLTSPELNYRALSLDKEVPVVEKLVMVGTPSHGSQLARFRAFAEVRDQLVHMLNGSINGLAFILDGAGEAKIDLLPGSGFLTELNSRPNPEGVEMIVIAGISAPWNDKDITVWVDTIGEITGHEGESQIKALREVLTSMTHGLGDGLVTLDSTRLSGASHITVSGTHLSMIRNILKESDRVPPAVPIVVEILKEKKG